MNKLYPQYQSVPEWAPGLVRQAGLRWVKKLFVNGNCDNPFAGARVVARLWIGGDGAEAEYVRRGERGGEEYFGRLQPWYEALRGSVYAFEGPNEQGVGTEEERANLDGFYVGWGRCMARGRLRTVNSFSDGTPDVTRKEVIGQLGNVWRYSTFNGPHQYGWPTMATEAEWHTLRHRKLDAVLRGLGLPSRMVLITECGLDGTGHGAGGWKTICGWDEYRRQWGWYDGELQGDRLVAGAFAFVSGPDARWESFNIGEGESRSLWLPNGGER